MLSGILVSAWVMYYNHNIPLVKGNKLPAWVIFCTNRYKCSLVRGRTFFHLSCLHPSMHAQVQYLQINPCIWKYILFLHVIRRQPLTPYEILYVPREGDKTPNRLIHLHNLTLFMLITMLFFILMSPHSLGRPYALWLLAFTCRYNTTECCSFKLKVSVVVKCCLKT